MNRQQLARYGERLACEYLEKKGYSLLDQNFKIQYGELDLVMLSPNKDRLIIVEVKTRYVGAKVKAKESITSSQLYQLKRTALFYKKQNKDNVPDSIHIDAIAVELNLDNSIKDLIHYKNITL